MSGSENDVEYELHLDGSATGYIESGNGGLIQFTVDAPGDYSVMATLDRDHTSCEIEMNGLVSIVEKPLPLSNKNIVVDDAGADCENGATITIENSEMGVVYEIYWTDNGSEGPTGLTVTGDGANVDFPETLIDGNGTYRVLASLDGCEAFLDNDFAVSIPNVITKYAILGDGAICEGDGGMNISLSSSEANVDYSLWSLGAGAGGSNVAISTITPLTGGDVLDFGMIAEAGDYIIVASNADCDSVVMHGMVELRFNPLPVAYQITGSGVFCDVAEGAVIGLNGSESYINYTLIWHDGDIPRVRGTAIGSGDALTFPGT